MSRIPRAFIDDLITRIDLVELIDARLPLKKTGSNFVACCPFHNEKSPSFTVSPAKQFYHCFGCGVSGNAIGFLMEFEHLRFVEAIEVLAAQAGMEIPKEFSTYSAPPEQHDLHQLLEKAMHFYKQQLRKHPEAIHYLKQRGLSGEIAKKFNIGYAPEGWDHLLKHLAHLPNIQTQLATTGMLVKKTDNSYYDRFRGRIMFPIHDRKGKIVGFGGRVIAEGTPKYLNSPETPLFHKGRELYGLHEMLQTQRHITRVLVVEGYMDVVMLAQYQIHFAVATLGTATTPEHLQRLLRISHEVIFCFDGDTAGKTAAWRALEATLPVLRDGFQIRFLFLPEGEDPDTLVQKEGATAFLARLDNATPLSDVLFQHLVAQVNLNKMDGKARLAKLALPLIQKIPHGVYQHMMLEQLAKIVHIDIEKLGALADSPPPQKTQMHRPVSNNRRLTPMRFAISLLLQNPALVTQVSKLPLMKWVLPGQELLNELITQLESQPSLTLGALLEYWRDRKEYPLLLKLATLPHPIPEEGLATELQETLKRLYQLNKKHQADRLMEKAQQEGLTEDEKQYLQSLISHTIDTNQ